MQKRLEHSQIHYRFVETLNTVVNRIKDVCDPKRAVEIATQKFSYYEVASAGEEGFCPENILNVPPKDRFDEVHALAIAIATGNVEATKLLLTHVDQEIINRPNITVWGYRQPYSALHLAVDPRGSMFGLMPPEMTEDYVDSLAQIVKILISKGADPDYIPNAPNYYHYRNPPMACGQPRGWGHLNHTDCLELRSLLLAEGANPELRGSSYALDVRGFTYAVLRELNSTDQYPVGGRKVLQAYLDPNTQERIFTYSFSNDGKDLGILKLKGFPLPCLLPENPCESNVIAVSGICTQWMPEYNSTIQRVCGQKRTSTNNKADSDFFPGVIHGALRGSSRVAEKVVKQCGYSGMAARAVQRSAYYGSVFLWRAYNNCQQQPLNLDPTYQMTALYQAALETGSIVLINEVLEMSSRAIKDAAQSLVQSGWQRASSILNGVGSMMRFGVFAYGAVQRGIIETAATVTAGVVTEQVTVAVGEALIATKR